MNFLKNICIVKILLLVFYAQNNIGMNRDFFDKRCESVEGTPKVNKNEFTGVKIAREESDLEYTECLKCSAKGREKIEEWVKEYENELEQLKKKDQIKQYCFFSILDDWEKKKLEKLPRLLERLKKIKSDDEVKREISYVHEKDKKIFDLTEFFCKKYLLSLPESIIDQLILAVFISIKNIEFRENSDIFYNYKIRFNDSDISKLFDNRLIDILVDVYFSALVNNMRFYFKHADEREKIEQYAQFDQEIKILFQLLSKVNIIFDKNNISVNEKLNVFLKIFGEIFGKNVALAWKKNSDNKTPITFKEMLTETAILSLHEIEQQMPKIIEDGINEQKKEL